MVVLLEQELAVMLACLKVEKTAEMTLAYLKVVTTEKLKVEKLAEMLVMR